MEYTTGTAVPVLTGQARNVSRPLGRPWRSTPAHMFGETPLYPELATDHGTMAGFFSPEWEQPDDHYDLGIRVLGRLWDASFAHGVELYGLFFSMASFNYTRAGDALSGRIEPLDYFVAADKSLIPESASHELDLVIGGVSRGTIIALTDEHDL